MMTTTAQQILDAVGVIANDVSSVRWPVSERVTWLNEGLRELVVRFPDANVSRQSVTLAQGAKQTLPAAAVALLEMRSDTGPVLPCSRQALDLFAQNWQHRPTASRVKNFMFAPQEYPTYWVYPAQNTTPATVELVFSAYPATVTAGSLNTPLSVQDKYGAKLVDYILYRALSKDAEVGSAARSLAYYQSFIS